MKAHGDGVFTRFLSTLSLRRATNAQPAAARAVIISIHALLAESDQLAGDTHPGRVISIHALLAESDDIAKGKTAYVQGEFLSTLSLRRASS